MPGVGTRAAHHEALVTFYRAGVLPPARVAGTVHGISTSRAAHVRQANWASRANRAAIASEREGSSTVIHQRPHRAAAA